MSSIFWSEVYPLVIKHGWKIPECFLRKITDFYGPWLPTRHGADDTGGYFSQGDYQLFFALVKLRILG